MIYGLGDEGHLDKSFSTMHGSMLAMLGQKLSNDFLFEVVEVYSLEARHWEGRPKYLKEVQILGKSIEDHKIICVITYNWHGKTILAYVTIY